MLLKGIGIKELWIFKKRDSKFKYFKDPLFIVCVVIYLVNRFLIEPLTIGKISFFNSYVNDLICFPFWLPIVLFLTRKVRLRGHNDPPDFYELLFYLLLWSYFFEFVGPVFGEHFNYPVADPWDIVCYAVGCAIAGIYWNYEIKTYK